MSLKILSSKDLHNPFVLPLQLLHTEQKAHGECPQYMENVLLCKYQKKKTKTKPGFFLGEKTWRVRWDEGTVTHLNEQKLIPSQCLYMLFV